MTARKELFELEKEDDLPRLPAEEDEEASPAAPTSYRTPPGTVVFGVGELGAYAVAVLALVVASYLLGAYAGRRRGAPPLPEPTMNVVPASESLLPDAAGRARPAPAPQPIPGKAPASPPAPPPRRESQAVPRYTLEVIRFRLEDRAVALIHKERLQKLGYVPAFLMPRGEEVGVCVGRFATRRDETGLRWRQEIRNIHRAYRHCEFIPLR